MGGRVAIKAGVLVPEVVPNRALGEIFVAPQADCSVRQRCVEDVTSVPLKVWPTAFSRNKRVVHIMSNDQAA